MNLRSMLFGPRPATRQAAEAYAADVRFRDGLRRAVNDRQYMVRIDQRQAAYARFMLRAMEWWIESGRSATGENPPGPSNVPPRNRILRAWAASHSVDRAEVEDAINAQAARCA